MEEATNPDEVSVFLSSVTTKLASPDVEYLDSVVTLDEYSEAPIQGRMASLLSFIQALLGRLRVGPC